jgi:hypothetical protein
LQRCQLGYAARALLSADAPPSLSVVAVRCSITCFTSTKVQIWTQKPEALYMLPAESIKQVLNLLALLVQKYKC